jgi:adenine/guanine phosphoribosyltransferase-like PRPP-binding protein
MEKALWLLSWPQFNDAVSLLAGEIEKAILAPPALAREHCAGREVILVGEPRGGLPLAVALSHRLCLKMVKLHEPPPRNWPVFWVDDVLDTGMSYCQAVELYGRSLVGAAVWVNKQPKTYPVISVRSVSPSTWIVFPWEDQGRAMADRDEFLRRRRLA